MEKITKLTLFVVLLGLIVFGQALGVATAQTEPSQPVIILATPDSHSAVTRPEQTAPLPTPIAQDAAQLPAPISSAGFIRDARLEPVENGFLVTWSTDQPTTGWVIYGPTPDALDSRAPAADTPPAPATVHSIAIPAPMLDAPLYFVIVVDGVRQDVAGWPFKLYAGDVGRSLAFSPPAGGDASALDAGQEIEPAAPNLDNSAPRVANGTNRIGIEAGHWPNDSGAMSCDNLYREADNNIGVANLAADILRARGYTVDVMSAGDARLNGYKADAFVALHNDWCPKSNGVPVWKSGFKVSRRGGAAGTGVNGSGDASDRLVNQVWDRYARVTGMPKDQQPGHFTNNMLYYYALGNIHASTPGVIIEMGWWHGDRDMLLNRRNVLAAGVAESVLAFLGTNGGDTDDNRTLGNGQTLNGNISPNNDKDTYYFDASANSRATIRMTRTSGDQLDSFQELYGPNGAMVAVDDDGGGNRNSLINNVQLSAGGRYKIVARSWSYASSGPYSLSLSLSGGSTTSCADGQYKAEYFNGRSLSGSPVFTRCESSINYDWGGGGPGNGVPTDNFSVRWTGRFNFDGGTKRFIARADDGIKVYLDGTTIIDGWRDQAPTEYRSDRTPSAGMRQVKVEYYENGGGAVAQVRWEAVSSSVSCPNQYKAEYWSNRNMSGNPVLVRCENWPLNHDWGGGSPGGGVPSDGFSARWTGQASINQGTYNFIARADDGIKVYLDGTTIIDAWRDQAPTEYRVTRSVNSGTHSIRIDYYENGGGAVAQFRWEATSNPGSGNLALNRTARASSQESSTYSPSRGNDGNNGTRWSSTISSSLGSQRWYVDLGSARSFNRVRINWETAYAASYRIVWSDDGVNWYYSGSNEYRSGSGWADHNISTRTRRYIGVTMLTRAPRMNNYSFFEFEVYNTTRATNSEATEGAPIETTAPEILEEDIFLPPQE